MNPNTRKHTNITPLSAETDARNKTSVCVTQLGKSVFVGWALCLYTLVLVVGLVFIGELWSGLVLEQSFYLTSVFVLGL